MMINAIFIINRFTIKTLPFASLTNTSKHIYSIEVYVGHHILLINRSPFDLQSIYTIIMDNIHESISNKKNRLITLWLAESLCILVQDSLTKNLEANKGCTRLRLSILEK